MYLLFQIQASDGGDKVINSMFYFSTKIWHHVTSKTRGVLPRRKWGTHHHTHTTCRTLNKHTHTPHIAPGTTIPLRMVCKDGSVCHPFVDRGVDSGDLDERDEVIELSCADQGPTVSRDTDVVSRTRKDPDSPAPETVVCVIRTLYPKYLISRNHRILCFFTIQTTIYWHNTVNI